MTVFRKFEVCASYEHLWLNRHLRQAAKRYFLGIDTYYISKNKARQNIKFRRALLYL